MRYLRMRPMDLMALVSFLHVSFMCYVSLRFLPKTTPRSRTLSVRSMTVLSKKSFSMLDVLVNRDVNNNLCLFSITSLHILHGPSHYIIHTDLEGSLGRSLICRIDSYKQLSLVCRNMECEE